MKNEILATSHDWAYIAGIIDGEGSIGYSGQIARSLYIIQVYNTNRELMDWLILKIGRGRVLSFKKRGCLNKKILYGVYWRGEDAIIVLRQTYDYLIVKKQLAKLILEQFDYEEKIWRTGKKFYYHNGNRMPSEEVLARRIMTYNKIKGVVI